MLVPCPPGLLAGSLCGEGPERGDVSHVFFEEIDGNVMEIYGKCHGMSWNVMEFYDF